MAACCNKLALLLLPKLGWKLIPAKPLDWIPGDTCFVMVVRPLMHWPPGLLILRSAARRCECKQVRDAKITHERSFDWAKVKRHRGDHRLGLSLCRSKFLSTSPPPTTTRKVPQPDSQKIQKPSPARHHDVISCWFTGLATSGKRFHKHRKTVKTHQNQLHFRVELSNKYFNYFSL